MESVAAASVVLAVMGIESYMSNRKAPSEPGSQLAPYGVVELQVVEFLSPERWFAFLTFILCMDAGSSNFAVNDSDEIMVWHTRLDKCIEPLEHIVGFHVGVKFG